MSVNGLEMSGSPIVLLECKCICTDMSGSCVPCCSVNVYVLTCLGVVSPAVGGCGLHVYHALLFH